MEVTGGVWPKTFKEAFCERFDCPANAYESRVFKHCLYRHARPVAWWFRRTRPEFFREDFDLIREVAVMDDPEVFRSELNFFYGRNLRDKNWLRRVLCLRVSAKRLLRLMNQVCEPA